MDGNPICEPFTDSPVKFDIEKLVAEFKPKEEEKNIDNEKYPRDFLHLPDETWRVLPMFKHQLNHMNEALSSRANPYLRCRYTKFLDNVPDHYVKIQLYPKESIRPKPRRMSLNGQFYGVDYKLAPIPVAEDPRNYGSSIVKKTEIKSNVTAYRKK